jgi:hypothetical protein
MIEAQRGRVAAAHCCATAPAPLKTGHATFAASGLNHQKSGYHAQPLLLPDQPVVYFIMSGCEYRNDR